MRAASLVRVCAGMAELVDALDLGSSAARRESSSLFPRTKVFDRAQDACGARRSHGVLTSDICVRQALHQKQPEYVLCKLRFRPQQPDPSMPFI